MIISDHNIEKVLEPEVIFMGSTKSELIFAFSLILFIVYICTLIVGIFMYIIGSYLKNKKRSMIHNIFALYICIPLFSIILFPLIWSFIISYCNFWEESEQSRDQS